MKYGRQLLTDAALGEWIRKNPEKCFAIATLEGVHTFKSVFTTHEQINAERDKQEALKIRFIYDEAGDINPDVWDKLTKATHSKDQKS